MAQTKSVIIFIVEGITDKISLGNIISKLYENTKIHFYIVNTDITSSYTSNTANILGKIGNVIKEIISTEHFNRQDIEKIVHVVDTDGAYISEENIKFDQEVKIKYEKQNIITKNVEEIKRRKYKKIVNTE